jgi:DNA adenine methylase
MHQHPHASAKPATASKPFLKWSGGKQRLLPELARRLPHGKRLIEPFVGAGSVFLGLQFESYVINDVNADLIAVWSALQNQPREFIERANALFCAENHTAEAYLRIRASFNEETDRFERAVMFPYLNRFGFNGLFRVNLAGKFNVPYGRPSSLPGFPLKEMEAAHDKLKCTTILNGGFAFATEQAGVGDVVYCDPPYLDSTSGASFTGYSSGGFTVRDHEELLEAGLRAVSRGATVVMSNHDTPQTRQLYRLWHQESVSVRRSIAANSSSRGEAKELIATMPWPKNSTIA